MHAFVHALGAAWLAFAVVPASAEGPYVRYQVELDAPAAVAGDLRRGLDLFRWQAFETMTRELLDRLVAEARDEIGTYLETKGFFAPRIDSVIAPGEPLRVQLKIDPGAQVSVAAVHLAFSGPVSAGDVADGRIMARVRDTWLLPEGTAFTQDGWDSAKRQALLAVSESRYPGARIASSEARIDPASGRAVLNVTIDSGPPLRFGAIEVIGLLRYDESQVRHLWTFGADVPFEREVLERFQRRLMATGYFATADVAVDAASAVEGRVPVRVTVIETASKRVELGVSYSTDTRFGTTVNYRDTDFLGVAWRLRTWLQLEQVQPTAGAAIDLPTRASGWSESVGVRARDKSVENLDTREVQLTARTAFVDERSAPAWGITYAYSDQYAQDALDEIAYATLLHYGHTWRTTDNLLSPRRGGVLYLEAGYAPDGVSLQPFGRGIARVAWFRQLARDTDLALRSELGAVFAESTAGIPQSMLFRTGGSTTVRGYDFESLGVERANAVLGGRYLFNASVEATQWFADGLGAALFVDAGNAADDLATLDPVWGIGVGARMRSPIGPLRADLAYGLDAKQFRIHFSVGVSF